MTDDLSPPHIVCAATRHQSGLIIPGARHFDNLMRDLISAIWGYDPASWVGDSWEQGFIDQHGRFYSREQAMKIVRENGQHFDYDRNGEQDQTLFSEGLY